MAGTTATIRVSGLKKQKLTELRKQAKTLGLTAEGYAKRLIEDRLLLERRARTSTFDELFGPEQARFRKNGMTEGALDRIVDQARTRHHRQAARKKS